MAFMEQLHDIVTTARTRRLEIPKVVDWLKEDCRITEAQAQGVILTALLQGTVSLVYKKVYPSRRSKAWCVEARKEDYG